MKLDKIKECLLPAAALMVIAAVVTAALAGVNLLTAETIDARAKEAENVARQKVIQADSFSEKTIMIDQTEVIYYEAYQKDTPVGYVFTVVSSGKSSGLTVMTGISAEGAVTGIEITENSETAGYVEKVISDGLLTRIQEANSTEVDVTSNATRTSKGIMNGVAQAKKYYEQITKEVTAP